MERTPSVVIVSSSNIKPQSLIKLISKVKNGLNSEEDGKVCHQWKIETKYYSANVNLIGISEKYERTPEFNEKVEALIILMDSNKKTGLSDLSVWESIEQDCDPEVKLLVTNYCDENTPITRAKATDWCLKQGFELIELYPNVESKTDDDEIIEEKVGVERVIEVLQTHVWPNLIMKGKEKESEEPKQEEASHGIDEFADIFQQLHVMKESIQSMPTQQRKQCAEQMVTAFWRAIGGDEEEIVDL